MQCQVGNTAVACPPMFLSALKETEQPLEDKHAALQTTELPLVPLHDLVPVKTKRALTDEEKARQAPVVPLLKEGDLIKTKQLYIALNHSLNKLVGFAWKDAVPVNKLRPEARGETRESFKDPTLGDMKFLYSSEEKSSCWQSAKAPDFRNHVRVTSVSDEGSSCFSLVSALAEHISLMPMRDTSHKMHRVIEMTMKGSPLTSEMRKEIGLCLKFDKAPWNTGRFGRRLREGVLVYANNMTEDDALLAPLRSSLEQELEVPEGDFELLRTKLQAWGQRLGTGRSISAEFNLGRWDGFTDGVHILFRQLFCVESKFLDFHSRKCSVLFGGFNSMSIYI